MPKKNNAQFSIEFIMLIAFMFLVFLGFISVVTSKIIEAKENERQQIAEDIAALARNEIDIAKSMADGYARNFSLPSKIKGNTYTIEIIDDRELVVKYLDKEYVEFLPEKVVGNVSNGLNEIKKINNIVYLKPINECDDSIDNDGDGFCDLTGSKCVYGSIPGDAGCEDKSDKDETNCGDTVCEGFESCSTCEGDCGTCFSLIKILLMKDVTANAISFRESGDVILKGNLNENHASPPTTANDEFIVKDSNGNAVAVVNLITGNMFIKGNKYENGVGWVNPDPARDDFIVKDSSGNAVSYIDDSGNFYLKGKLIKGEP